MNKKKCMILALAVLPMLNSCSDWLDPKPLSFYCLVCHRPCQPLAAERGGLGLVLILLVTNHVCLILKLIIRMKNRYRSGEAALPFFPFRYNKDNTLILCRCA